MKFYLDALSQTPERYVEYDILFYLSRKMNMEEKQYESLSNKITTTFKKYGAKDVVLLETRSRIGRQYNTISAINYVAKMTESKLKLFLSEIMDIKSIYNIDITNTTTNKTKVVYEFV